MNVADQYNSTIINFICNCLKEGRKTLTMITGYSTNTELMNMHIPPYFCITNLPIQ